MTVDEAITIVKRRLRGRTRYEGQEPFIDEILVAEVERLKAEPEAAKAVNEMEQTETSLLKCEIASCCDAMNSLLREHRLGDEVSDAKGLRGTTRVVHAYCGQLRTELDAAKAELAEARAILERLPLTADGVRVTPGMTLWAKDGNSYVVEAVYSGGYWLATELSRFYREGKRYYSTAAAARAAAAAIGGV